MGFPSHPRGWFSSIVYLKQFILKDELPYPMNGLLSRAECSNSVTTA
jgi:hypothetical protein